MRLEDLKPDLSINGLEPGLICRLERVDLVGDSARVLYMRPDGEARSRVLNRSEESSLSLPITERPWSFAGNGEAFKLAIEAKRMDLAFLFDPMMAVHTSNVDPLPHQITAVYQSMLPRQPLRFVLADDPGAGKTIMAGLYIRELIIRADARRVLIVAPGSLVEQWQQELYEKFGLEFKIYSGALDDATPSGNAFADNERLIVRLDQLSRNEELQEKLCQPGWDLTVFDEAHKLAAHYNGMKLERTARFRFAEKLGAQTRHLLLMTATPHSGKEPDYQLFLSLLDTDRFYGKFRDGVHQVDATDLMRRMVKEEMLKFDGTPLFPERRAYTVDFKLSDLEAELYTDVTDYVKTEMGKADQLEGAQKGSVGFALTALQRRLASSPEAIYQSLKRRRERLEKRLSEARIGERGRSLKAEVLRNIPVDMDELDAEETESLEEETIDKATAAQTIVELAAEIEILAELQHKAKNVVSSGLDRKWDELSKIIQNNPEMRNASGKLRKIIVFTEHRDTLSYLVDKISGVIGNPGAIAVIHGGTHRDERRKQQALFRSDPEVRILIATDAAGEGVNLQNANLMVNYDLPWNPNRLEQRFGRIHRINQDQVCHLWNLVAMETREGDVYRMLLKKLEIEDKALNGKVFKILGEVFEDKSLKDLMIEAIRSGETPEVRQRMFQQKIDMVMDRERLKKLINRNALSEETLGPERLFAVKEEMERAEARRLQPYFVRAFFKRAFEAVGGTMHPREANRYEVTHVPQPIRERDRRITGRNRREQAPVLTRYSRVCFTKEAMRPMDTPGLEPAELIHPGHPLMLAVSDLLLEQSQNLLREGTILVDPVDPGQEPYLLFLLTHEVQDGQDQVLSKRMQFITVKPDGSSHFAGWAPHLDLTPLAEADRPALAEVLNSPWIKTDLEDKARLLATGTLATEHFETIKKAKVTLVEKTLVAVHERLTKEIQFWSDKWMRLEDDRKAGKDVRLNLENARRTVADLEARLEARKKELQAQRLVKNGEPLVLGGALVIPAGLLARLKGDTEAVGKFAADAAARARIEKIAMDAVRRSEEAMGYRVDDVSADKCGWDLTSYPVKDSGHGLESRHIEVKGRVKGADEVTVTYNEVFQAWNQGDKFHLAIVLVGEDDRVDGPYYIQKPFEKEPDTGVASFNYRLEPLLAKAKKV